MKRVIGLLVLAAVTLPSWGQTLKFNYYCVSRANGDYWITIQYINNQPVATFMDIDHGDADTRQLAPSEYRMSGNLVFYGNAIYECSRSRN